MSGYLALKVMENQDNTAELLINNNVEQNGTTADMPLHREELLLAVKSSDAARLRHALHHSAADPSLDLDLVYPHPDLRSLVHIAATNNEPTILRALLDKGAAVDQRDHRSKKFTALHYAAQNGSPEVIRTLLERGADVNAKEGEHGRTCLHLLAIRWKPASDGLDECLTELLKQKRIKLDRRDGSGATPLYLAAQKGWEGMARTLVLKGASLDVKVGSKTVKDVLKRKLPNLLDSINWEDVETITRCFGDDLFDALKEGDLDAFKGTLAELNEKEKASKTIVLEEDHGAYTLLNYACENGMTAFVDALLEEEADPTHADKTSLLSPVLYAAKNGYDAVMESVLKAMKRVGGLKRGLRAADKRRETALHKVVKREQPPVKGRNYLACLQRLLSHKGYLDIDAQDEFARTPLHYAVLCDDQSFVRQLLIGGANLGVRSRFGVLAITRVQPSVLQEVLDDCVKHRNNVNDRDFEIILHYSMLAPTSPQYRPETDCLKFLSSSRPHRHLLRHPIIDTFLFLKWQRIRHYYFINLAAYTAFLLLLTTYIMLFFGAVRQDLLSSPPGPDAPLNATASATSLGSSETPVKVTLQVVLSVLWLLGVVREAVQLTVSFRAYVSSLENWLEISILAMTPLVLFAPLPYASLQGMAAWLVLASWVEMVLILGRHPIFALYVTMLTTVTFNFLKFILMFSFILVAFTLSFYLVFQTDENFASYPATLLKTIAMSTGEIEYSSLPLSAFPLSSHLLFVIFVFLVVLVLMNLLNGLAVSDIQQIQQEAELVSYRSRVELISYIESAFLSSPRSSRGKRDEEEEEGRLCPSPSCCFLPRAPANPFSRLLRHLGKRTLMFRHCLRDHRITVYPNKERDRWQVCQCHSFNLQEAQIEAAKSVVLTEDGKVANRLAGLESRVDSVMAAIESLTDMVRRRGVAGVTVAAAE